MAGCESMASVPLAKGKLAVESRLERSRLQSVIVRPEAFQEIWLSPEAQLDWHAGRLVIFGRGEAKMPYVAIDDVAEAVVTLTTADRPPSELTFGGP
jgi:uncharacterized protein YbjT (DUF2867 family)